MVLSPELIKLIDDKALFECGVTNLRLTYSYICQLNAHINGTFELEKNQIKSKVDFLASFMTITLDHPINELEFLRVRRCDGQNFANVDDLSYIKRTTDSFPQAGRLNQIGQALFYASVAIKKNDHTALKVVLSEVGAKELEHLNVLRSHQVPRSDLNLRIIGIWDLVKRDEKPNYLSNDTFAYYKLAKEYMIQKFERELLLAYELTDNFFADILSREGNEKLYQVTAMLSNVFLSGNSDGVLYSSVKAKGEPVVALTPKAVDSKLEHQFATEVLIDIYLSDANYQFKTLSKTSNINKISGKLNWYIPPYL